VSPEQRADRISSPGGWSGNSIDTASSGRRVQLHASPGKSFSSGKSYGSSNSRSGCRLRLIQSSPGGKSSKSSGSGVGSVSKSNASIWLDQVVQAKLRSPNPHSKGQLNHDSTNIYETQRRRGPRDVKLRQSIKNVALQDRTNVNQHI